MRKRWNMELDFIILFTSLWAKASNTLRMLDLAGCFSSAKTQRFLFVSIKHKNKRHDLFFKKYLKTLS